MYSDLYLRSQRKPSLILVAVAGIVLTVFGVSFFKLPSVPTRASKQVVVRQNIVNSSPREVDIFWQTDQKTTGWVVYGENKNSLSNLSLDERDLEDQKTSSLYHFVRLKDLQASHTYYYKLVNNDALQGDASGQPFQFSTIKDMGTGTAVNPAYGKVIGPNGDPAVNALVLFEYPNAVPLLTLAKVDGGWLVPLTYLVDASGQMLSVDQKSPVTIEVLLDDQKPTTVQTTVADTSPLSRTIIIGQNVIQNTDTNVLPASTVNTTISVTQPPQQSVITILFPKEGALIPGINPLIKGTAVPGKVVHLKINSKPEQNVTVTASTTGEWHVSTPLEIVPGKYVLTLITVDAKNVPVTVKRSFAIDKSGEQVLAAATAPAILTATPTQAPLPTSVPTVAQPTFTISTPTPVVGQVTATPTPPITGTNTTLIVAGSFALVIAGVSLLIFL